MAVDQLQLRAIRENSYPLAGSTEDYAPLLDLIGNNRLLLIGEASHGTHDEEFAPWEAVEAAVQAARQLSRPMDSSIETFCSRRFSAPLNR